MSVRSCRSIFTPERTENSIQHLRHKRGEAAAWGLAWDVPSYALATAEGVHGNCSGVFLKSSKTRQNKSDSAVQMQLVRDILIRGVAGKLPLNDGLEATTHMLPFKCVSKGQAKNRKMFLNALEIQY